MLGTGILAICFCSNGDFFSVENYRLFQGNSHLGRTQKSQYLQATLHMDPKKWVSYGQGKWWISVCWENRESLRKPKKTIQGNQLYANEHHDLRISFPCLTREEAPRGAKRRVSFALGFSNTCLLLIHQLCQIWQMVACRAASLSGRKGVLFLNLAPDSPVVSGLDLKPRVLL